MFWPAIMRARVEDPRLSPAWESLVRRSDASVFHSPQWMQTLTDTYGFDFKAVIVGDDTGAAQAGLPFAVVEGLRSRRLIALPFSDFCDPMASNAEEWEEISESLMQLGMPVKLRCMRCVPALADSRFSRVGSYAWHGLDVSEDSDSIRRRLHRSAKNKINKATKAGIEVEAATDTGELRAFFDLHLRVRKYRHRLLAQPYRFFENLWHQMIETDLGTLLVARLDGQIIGGAVLLQWNDTLFYKFSAMMFSEVHLGTNDVLLWESILHAKRRDLRFLDLGLSDWDQPGLVDFKRKFATHEREIHALTHVPQKEPTARDGDVNALLAGATELLTDPETPDSVTEAAGDALYGHFA